MKIKVNYIPSITEVKVKNEVQNSEERLLVD